MKNISLTFQRPQLRINGEVFDVRRSDAGILQDLIDLEDRFADKDMQNTENILGRNRAMLEYIDTLLGAGAAERIRDSIPGMDDYDLGIAGVEALLTKISSAAVNAYSQAISAKYDD